MKTATGEKNYSTANFWPFFSINKCGGVYLLNNTRKKML